MRLGPRGVPCGGVEQLQLVVWDVALAEADHDGSAEMVTPDEDRTTIIRRRAAALRPGDRAPNELERVVNRQRLPELT